MNRFRASRGARTAALAAAVSIAALAPTAAQENKSSGDAASLDKALIEQLLEHVKRVDSQAESLRAPEFPSGKEWFNSAPLRLDKELRGKVVVLDFWTYCCINCIHILPDLAYLEAKYAGRPVAFVGVHSAKFDNEKVSENILHAVLRYEIAHPVVNDDAMSMWRAIRVRSWPTLVVVGPRGNLLLMVAGEGRRDVIDAAIEAALRFYPADTFRHEPLPLALERDKPRGAPSPLRFPGKLAIDADGKRLFISDSNHHRIVVTDLDGKFLDAIGSGRRGLEDGTYAEAAFNRLQGLAYHAGKLYIADAENHALRAVDLDKRIVATLAGNGRQGRDYEGGARGAAQELSTPWDVLVDGGTVFIAMAGTHQIWTYDLSSGIAGAYSGSGAEQNLNSEDLRRAAWSQPSGLALGGGELFIADSESSSVRGIKLPAGPTRSIAGGDDGEPRDLFAFGDEDGIGDAARLQHPLGVLWLESKKRVLVADTYNHRLKLVDPETRAVESWAGSGKAGLEDGEGLAARFSEPAGFALAPDGKRVYVADANNHAIRIVDLETRRVSTLKLESVPAAAPAVPPRSERLAELPDTPVLRAEALKLAPDGAGEIAIDLRLPEGHHYAEGAPSRWQVLHQDAMPLAIEDSAASGPIPAGGAIRIPVRGPKAKASGAIRIEAVAYFCKDQGACRIGAVLFEVPVEVGEGGEKTATVKLGHGF
jgi:thiol-disulfide isomerase/thioredoxin